MAHPRPRSPLALALLSCAAISCLDAPRPEAEGPRSRITPEFAKRLDGDADAFRDYARGWGASMLKEAMIEIERSIDATTVDAFQRDMAAVRPRLERIASALETEFDYPEYLRDIRLKADAAPERGCAIYREMRAFPRDVAATAEPEARARRLMAAHDRFEALGYRRGVMFVEAGQASVSAGMGRPRGRLHHMLAAAEVARELGETFMLCQYLGDVGDAYEDLGAPDSAVACYRQALAIALERRDPVHAPRLMNFIAHIHEREGRLALATEWIEEAIPTSRALGGSAAELRFIVNAMRHYAGLGCWDVVERLLARCPIAIREFERVSSVQQWSRDVPRIEAQLRLARGDLEGARSRFLDARRQQARLTTNETIILLDDWSRGLVAAGHASEALPIVEEGFRISDRVHNDRMTLRFVIRHARVLFALGRYREASEALARFDCLSRGRPGTPAEMRVEHQVLEARLLALAGDRVRAREALARCLDALRRHARRLDAGPLGYLALGALDDVRFAVHEIAGLDAAASYHFELRWRALVRELGAGARAGPGAAADAEPADLAPWELESGDLEPPALPGGTTHLVFLVTPDRIVRWTATGAGIARDTLPLTPAECTSRVERVLESLDRGPGHDGPSRQTAGHADLRHLANALLPASALPAVDERSRRRLLVSPDGPLERLPFEALDGAARGAYRPLALDCDIARLRSPSDPAPDRAGGAPSILADPIASQEILRRFPALARLPASEREASAALWQWDGARVLRGGDARKSAVLEAWRDAPGIYVVAHLVRDPDLPFSPFVPLAGDSSMAGPRDDCLEIADVRALDLSGCELAVISTCSSGAPYAGSRRMGPSFGDGFVDAGAGCVVQAAWEVDDARAARLMERFLAEWRSGARDPVGALAAARRAAIRGELGPSDPRDWAAWSVSVAPSWSRDAMTAPALARRP